jgi:hypothetical protein
VNLCIDCTARVGRTRGQRTEICIGCIRRARQLIEGPWTYPFRPDMPPDAGLARRLAIRCARIFVKGWRASLRNLVLCAALLAGHWMPWGYPGRIYWKTGLLFGLVFAIGESALDKLYGKKL